MFLSPKERKQLVRVLIPDMVKDGFSANKGLRILRYIGIGIRRKTYLEIWRLITKPKPLRSLSVVP